MQSMAQIGTKLKAVIPDGVLIASAIQPAWTMPDKPLHAFTVQELNAAIEHCQTCNGIGYHRLDVAFGDPDFGRVTRCPACAKYAAELATRRRLDAMQPLLDRYSMLKDELLAKTFDNFDRKQAPEAFDAVRQWATGVYKGTPPHLWLYLWGTTGNGKTHLAAATANGLLRGNIAVMFSTFTELCGMAAAANFNDKEDVIRALQAVTVLIIDDITEQELRTDWKQSLLFRVADSRYVGNKPTLFVSNMPVALPTGSTVSTFSLRDFEARIASRIMDKSVCKIVGNTGSDYRVK